MSWNLLSPTHLENSSTKRYDRVEYNLQSQLADNTTNFRFEISDKESWFLLSETYVQCDFQVFKDATYTSPLTLADNISLQTPWALFKTAQLKMFSKQFPTIDDPGTNIMLTQIPAASSDYQRSVASAAGFYPFLSPDRGHPTTAASQKVTKVPPLSGATAVANDYAPTGYVAANNALHWYPHNDKSSKVQYEFIEDNSGNVSWTGRIRPNTHHDDNFIRGQRAISSTDGTAKTCSVMLPLRDIYPMLSQVFPVVNKGANLTLNLTKQNQKDLASLFYFNGTSATGAPANMSVRFTKLALWTVHMEPSLDQHAKVMSLLAQNSQIVRKYEELNLVPPVRSSTNTNRVKISSEASKPVRAFIALRHATRVASPYHNRYQYDPLALEHVYVRVNGVQFPSDRLELLEHPTRVLQDLHKIVVNTNDYTDGSLVDYENFVNGPCRIYGIDLSQISDDVFKDKSVSDVEIIYKVGGVAVPHDAIILMVNEKELTIAAVNQEMSIRA